MGKVAFYIGTGRQLGSHFMNTVLREYPDRVAFIETEDGSHLIDRYRLEGSSAELFDHTSEDMTLDRINEFGVTTLVMIWWPKILKKLVKVPDLNILNTHPSYLPYNRGKHPYYWALMDGTPFGATIHRVDAGIDTGSILWRKQIELEPTDTGATAYLKSLKAVGQLLIEHKEDILLERLPPAIRQDEGKATYHHSSEFELPPIRENEMYDGHTLIRDCMARTFRNNRSGRRIEIDGKMYRVHMHLVEEE